ALRKSKMGDGHGLTRRTTAYLGRVCLAEGKTDECVAWLRKLLSAGVVRTGMIAGPGTGFTREPSGLADINRLGDALSGKAKQDASEQLLDELTRTLDWLMWRPDWLRAHVRSLYFESLTQHAWPAEVAVRQSLTDAIGAAHNAISVMEANPTTPRRYLDE